ncbi:MAG: hypothetical protein HYR85_27135, partial [Planctomycetes bacterium]|nr:hypothetical protein [Planctomycetota bacterium]
GGGGGGGGSSQQTIAPGTIVAFAGQGTIGIGGDGGPAKDAFFSFPLGITRDADGNFLIADTSNNRIRKIDTEGIVTTVAGIEIPGSYGDGGPATEAMLFFPRDVSIGPDGTMFIADSENHRIRAVDRDGIIRTVAGTGLGAYGGDEGPATAAFLNAPHGVFAEADGSLLIADQRNNRIRRVDPAGVIHTIAGTGIAGFSGDGGPATSAQLGTPARVARDPFTGDVFIADSLNNRIRRIDAAGNIRTVAGNGSFSTDPEGGIPGNSTVIRFVWELAFDPQGNVYFPDGGNYRVRVYNPQTTLVHDIAGTGFPGFNGDVLPALQAELGSVEAVNFNLAGELGFADRTNNRIRVIGADGMLRTIVGNGERRFAGDGGPATQASIAESFGLIWDRFGNLFIGDSLNHVVRIVTTDGIIHTYAGMAGDGGFSGDGGHATSAKLFYPTGISLDLDENVIITDYYNHCVRKIFRNSGIIVTIVGQGGVLGYSGDGGLATQATLFQPYQTSTDQAGNLYVADSNNNCIRIIRPNGIIDTFAGGDHGRGTKGFAGDGGPAIDALLNDPCGVRPDAFGNLWIGDSHNSMLRVITTDGIIHTVVGLGLNEGGQATESAVHFPLNILPDGQGNIYFADQLNSRIRAFSLTTGVIRSIVGNGLDEDQGDGGPALQAAVRFPGSCVFDRNGDLIVADTNNHRIRRVVQPLKP